MIFRLHLSFPDLCHWRIAQPYNQTRSTAQAVGGTTKPTLGAATVRLAPPLGHPLSPPTGASTLPIQRRGRPAMKDRRWNRSSHQPPAVPRYPRYSGDRRNTTESHGIPIATCPRGRQRPPSVSSTLRNPGRRADRRPGADLRAPGAIKHAPAVIIVQGAGIPPHDRSSERNKQHRPALGRHLANLACPRCAVRSGNCMHLLIAGWPSASPACSFSG
jgi:hypothetical protein